MDLSEVVTSIVTVAVAAASAYKASRGAAGSVSKQVSATIEGPDHKLDQIIEKQKNDSTRIDSLSEDFKALRVAFNVRDNDAKKNEEKMDLFLDSAQKLVKIANMNAQENMEFEKSKKVWLDENLVKITSVKKGNKNEG